MSDANVNVLMCPKCNGPMLQLFTSVVCRDDCGKRSSGPAMGPQEMFRLGDREWPRIFLTTIWRYTMSWELHAGGGILRSFSLLGSDIVMAAGFNVHDHGKPDTWVSQLDSRLDRISHVGLDSVLKWYSSWLDVRKKAASQYPYYAVVFLARDLR